MRNKPLSSEARDALTESSFEGQVIWQPAELQGDRARLQPVLPIPALAAHLDEALGIESWAYQLSVISVSPAVVHARLELGGSARDGLGSGLHLEDASRAALSAAAAAFGIGEHELSAPHRWAPYDPEQPTAAATLAPAHSSTAQPSPEPVKPKAHQHIDEMMERLKEAGLGLEAAKLSMRYGGYGSTLEESRQLYAQLRDLLRERSGDD
ncbi:hypothetical protein HNR42_003436 [Deinobacterium chartae]|uniref:Single-stranded DNA-binding protein n=1 Tax=Deinobacterium chartae TaxID=521158 RepID=A0A841I852_9DEIO|nr:single-stranded DNA-binding protein [Deinobacterium chartae]MBB6099975.1 hypothetical protein [Deinobacterium chartae]